MNPPGTRVLIVDDNDMNVVVARTVLVAGGFVVESASGGAEALAKVAPFGPDLILMDMQMPGISGFELTRVLKADPLTRHICIVAFTAFAMRGDEAKMRAAGCHGYLSKPIEVNTFAAQVRGCMLAAAPGMPPRAGRPA